ncbi:MAG: DUF58 domain-containing protein [Deltaproteobacteria bacterium]|nr:MAG: DUF58 domain-containing protein [Deltaproteobacteria bacterium]
MSSAAPSYDPAVLARVQRLHLKARILTEALLQGDHRSRRVGQAIEFAGYHEYLPGHDLRHLDWRVWGRSDKLVVKTFETETELPVTVVLDLSADLATGAPAVTGLRRLKRLVTGEGTQPSASLPDLDKSKAGFALSLAATLLYYFYLRREPIGLELIAGEGRPIRSIPPRSGRGHLQALLLTLAQARPGGEARLHEALVAVGERSRRRSLVLVLSDGMEEPETWLPAVAAFGRRRTDLRFIHLYDRREWGLELDQAARLYSPETGEEIAVDPAAARTALREVATEYAEEVRRGVTSWGGLYVKGPINEGLEPLVRKVIRGAPASPGGDPFGGEAKG